MSWRDSALRVMFTVHAEQSKSGANPQQIADAIDQAYPFGERKYHPYKVWLSARKWFFCLKGLPNKRGKQSDDLLTQLGEVKANAQAVGQPACGTSRTSEGLDG